MNLSEPAVLLAVLFLFIAGFAAGLIWADVRNRRVELPPVPTCLADPQLCGELDACRDLIDQFDQALDRRLDQVADGGHDDGALALLGVLDRTGISRDRLCELSDFLAWLAVYDDLHGDDSPEQSRRDQGLARLASRVSRTTARRHASGAGASA